MNDKLCLFLNFATTLILTKSARKKLKKIKKERERKKCILTSFNNQSIKKIRTKSASIIQAATGSLLIDAISVLLTTSDFGYWVSLLSQFTAS